MLSITIHPDLSTKRYYYSVVTRTSCQIYTAQI